LAALKCIEGGRCGRKSEHRNGKNLGMMNILNGYVVMQMLMVEEFI
jgi:hypothetical protein